MKTFRQFSIFFLAILTIWACNTSSKVVSSSTPTDDGKLSFIILQLNDVYEIAPLSGGKVGGMARVATVKHELLKENPRVFTVLAGDFLNPSLLGTMKYEGERLQGRQMVEVMNELGVDLVAFGNHEFDLDAPDLMKRINESDFTWLGTNLRYACGDVELPFFQSNEKGQHFLPDEYIHRFKDEDGTKLNVGFFSACINSNPRDYVRYYNADSCAGASIARLEDDADVILGLTHLSVDHDVDLLKAFPQVPLIMGGHEHDHQEAELMGRFVTKADANAKSVYIHRIEFDVSTGETMIKSELKEINDEITDDPKVKSIVDKWQDIMERELKKIISNPDEVIHETTDRLDGREVTNRQIQTNMGRVFASAMKSVAKKPVDAAIINSGSIRIDDQLQHQVRAIDIFRCLPFGGGIIEVDIKGELLLAVLNESEERKGTGAYLQRSEDITRADASSPWLIDGQPIDKDEVYHIIISDYLLLGFDIPALTADDPGISHIDRPGKDPKKDVRADIRAVIIQYLRDS